MNKIAESLTERYVLETIRKEALRVFKQRFIEAFKACCESKDEQDTTIGQTFKLLNQMAIIQVNLVIDELFEDLRIYSYSDNKANPLLKVLDSLLNSYSDYMDIKGWVESVIDDEYHDKKEELIGMGLIDSEGDYTGAVIETN